MTKSSKKNKQKKSQPKKIKKHHKDNESEWIVMEPPKLPNLDRWNPSMLENGCNHEEKELRVIEVNSACDRPTEISIKKEEVVFDYGQNMTATVKDTGNGFQIETKGLPVENYNTVVNLNYSQIYELVLATRLMNTLQKNSIFGDHYFVNHQGKVVKFEEVLQALKNDVSVKKGIIF